ncbi:hypothetical protein [Marinobacter adhaerens]|uniref:hypothetical protein n=1 Tax=Marinobacter adhaerens TaxID=1033846 RepID=UPI003D0D4FF8
MYMYSYIFRTANPDLEGLGPSSSQFNIPSLCEGKSRPLVFLGVCLLACSFLLMCGRRQFEAPSAISKGSKGQLKLGYADFLEFEGSRIPLSTQKLRTWHHFHWVPVAKTMRFLKPTAELAEDMSVKEDDGSLVQILEAHWG